MTTNSDELNVDDVLDDFMLLCIDDARPTDFLFLRSLISDAIDERNILNRNTVDLSVIQTSTMKVVSRLLNTHLIETFLSGNYTYEQNGKSVFCYEEFPVILPADEVLRRIYSAWDCIGNDNLSFNDCAKFLYNDDSKVHISPFITNHPLYSSMLKEYCNNIITSDKFVETFLNQYCIDLTTGPFLNDTQNTFDTLLYELHNKRISYLQFCICTYVRNGILPEFIPARLLLELIHTDCLCYKMKDTASCYHLNSQQLKDIIERRFYRWSEILDSAMRTIRTHNDPFLIENVNNDYLQGWRDAIADVIKNKFPTMSNDLITMISKVHNLDKLKTLMYKVTTCLSLLDCEAVLTHLDFT